MNIQDTIMMDVLELTVLESDEPLVRLDLEFLENPLCILQENSDMDIIPNDLINVLVNKLQYRELWKRSFQKELSDIFYNQKDIYNSIPTAIAINRLGDMTKRLSQVTEIADMLAEYLNNYGLYSASGTLLIDAVYIKDLRCALAKMKSKPCKTQAHRSRQLSQHSTYLTSQNSSTYLKEILGLY